MFRKTKPPLTVNIPNPCHENWQQMDAVESGRFCQTCQTVVTDFSALSDDEIIKHIEQAAGSKMCGRFSEFQINRPLIPEIKVHRISAFRKVAASVLMFYASLNEAMAQAPGAPKSTYVNANSKKPAIDTSSGYLRGKVLDFTGKAVSDLEMQIEGTELVQTTDTRGSFKFYLRPSFNQKLLTISATANGQKILDSIGAVIRAAKVDIGSLPLKKLITINAFPADTLQEVAIKQIAWEKRFTVQGTIGTPYPPTVPPLVPKKKTVMQKFKDIFKSKKSA